MPDPLPATGRERSQLLRPGNMRVTRPWASGVEDGAEVTLPVVSVLTPSYNQARWLPDNLHSVAVQSYPAIEHVVMDGGSTDGSVQILAAASPPVIWESGADRGQSDAINKAFARSTGDIIGWLNSDDAYFSNDVVARVVALFNDRPEVGVVYGHAALVNGDGTLLYVLWTPPFARLLPRAYNAIYQPAVFIRRSVIARPYLVDPDFDYSMDRELWLYLSQRTRFQRLNQIVAIDRHHLERKSYTRLDLAAHDQELIKARYRVSGVASNRIVHKTLGIAVRLAGLTKVVDAAQGSDAVSLGMPSLGVLAVRQVAQLRRWMPTGDSPQISRPPTLRPPGGTLHWKSAMANARTLAGTWPLLREAHGKIRALVTYRTLQRSPSKAIRYLLFDREIDNFTYDITNRDELAAFLAVVLERDVGLMRRYIDELDTDRELRKAIEDAPGWLSRRKGTTMPYGRRLGWYAVVRATKPRLAVETGVHDGLGSAVILRALARNADEGAEGVLLSFDVRSDVAWLVPSWLRSRYELRISDALATLGEAVAERRVDFFVHDSDHRYEHETGEFEAVLRLASPSAVLISDNAHAGTAFRDFCARRGLVFSFWREVPDHPFYPGAGIGVAVVHAGSERNNL